MQICLYFSNVWKKFTHEAILDLTFFFFLPSISSVSFGKFCSSKNLSILCNQFILFSKKANRLMIKIIKIWKYIKVENTFLNLGDCSNMFFIIKFTNRFVLQIYHQWMVCSDCQNASVLKSSIFIHFYITLFLTFLKVVLSTPITIELAFVTSAT